MSTGAGLGVGGRKEEHVHPLDERAVIRSITGRRGTLVEPVGKPAGVEAS